MASIECNIGTIPDSYQEIQCSLNSTPTVGDSRSFICKPGYKNSLGNITITQSTSPSCDYTTSPLECEKLPYNLPGIVRPDKSENFHCGPSNIQTATKETIRSCLNENVPPHSPGLLRNRCNSVNGCSFQRYKGDYLKKTEIGGASNIQEEHELISFEEANKLYPQATNGDRVCWDKSSMSTFNSPTTGTVTTDGPGSDQDCITLEHYDLNTPPANQTDKVNIETGNNFSDANTPYNLYMGYNISTNSGDKFIGTTVYDTLHKIDSAGYPDYYPGSTPNEAASDFRYTCNNQSYFHGNNIVVDVPTQSLSSNPSDMIMSGCEMNTCYHTDSTFRNIYDLVSIRPTPTTRFTCNTPGDESFFTCAGDESQFGIYNDDSCTSDGTTVSTTSIQGNLPSVNIDSLQCNYCGVIDSEGECNNNNSCYWYQSAGESLSECRNKCEARTTLGECEQFYVGQQDTLSDTLYNFDGKDNQCVWIPNYFNNDKSMGSTDGKCRDKDSPCFPPTPALDSSPCQITIPSKMVPLNGTAKNGRCYLNESDIDIYIKDPYCAPNYINKYEEDCIKSTILQPNCTTVSKPFKCVSDGEPYIDDNNIKQYTTDKECLQINDPSSCDIKDGCISIHSQSINEAKSIRELLENQSLPYDILKDICKPLKAQVPLHYDANLVEEEGINLASYSENHNVDPPFITSRYLCDICHIRDKDIIKMHSDPTNPHYNINPEDYNSQEYCEKPIDKYDSINQRRPCKWLNGECMSRCKIPFVTPNSPPQLSSDGLEAAKETCTNTLQFSDSAQYNIPFPNINNGEEVTDDYYKDMYCTWDGFECHNSIPCKEAQRTRCEDLGYDWYVGTAEDINYQKENAGESHDPLLTTYPVKRQGDGDPIIGDSEGICIFPNTEHIFVGSSPEYTMRNEFIGNNGIVLRWREFGTDWTIDNSLNRRKRDTSNTIPNASDIVGIIRDGDFTPSTTSGGGSTAGGGSTTSGVDPPPAVGSNNTYISGLTDVDLGENLIFIPFEIRGGESADEIKEKINTELQSYNYFAMNGDYIVHAKTIFEWAINNYNELWYGSDAGSAGGGLSSSGINARGDTQDDMIYHFGGYLYYKYGDVSGKHTDANTRPSAQELYADPKLWDSDTGLPASTNIHHDVVMCNVIYDLRGIINLLPVINGRCVLEITEFRINPDDGNVHFKMYPFDVDSSESVMKQESASNPYFHYKTYQRFQFHSFIGNEIFNDSGNIDDDKDDNLDIYRRYNTDSFKDNIISYVVDSNVVDSNVQVDEAINVKYLQNMLSKMGSSKDDPSTEWDKTPDGTVENRCLDASRTVELLRFVRGGPGALVVATGSAGCNTVADVHPDPATVGGVPGNGLVNVHDLLALLGVYTATASDGGFDVYSYRPAGASIPTIKGGYGSLYEPFITHKDKLYIFNNISIDSINSDGVLLPVSLEIEDIINPQYLNYSFKYDKYKNNGVDYNLDDVFFREKDSNLVRGGRSENKFCKCSGSYESFKYKTSMLSGYNSSIDDYKKHYVNCSLQSQPLIKLLRRYNKEHPLNSTQTDIVPKDIRKALLWSMTRPVHPAFGDLIYDPGYEGDNDQLFRSGAQTQLLVESKSLPYIITGTSTKSPPDRDTINIYPEYSKHLLDPFVGGTLHTKNTDVSGGMIKWDNLMTYIGGNYNKILQFTTLPNPTPENGWWSSGDQPWNDGLNTVLTNNNTQNYYKTRIVSYINLTPNNDIIDTDESFNIITNSMMYIRHQTLSRNDYSAFYELRPNINKKAFKPINSISSATPTDYNQYYYPGKWLNPPSHDSWPTSTSEPGGFGNWSDPTVVDPSGRLIGETNMELQRLKQLFGNNSSRTDLQSIPSILGDLEKEQYFNISYPSGTGTPATDSTHPHRKPGELLSNLQHAAWPSNSLIHGRNCSDISKYMDNIWDTRTARPQGVDRHYLWAGGRDFPAGTRNNSRPNQIGNQRNVGNYPGSGGIHTPESLLGTGQRDVFSSDGLDITCEDYAAAAGKTSPLFLGPAGKASECTSPHFNGSSLNWCNCFDMYDIATGGGNNYTIMGNVIRDSEVTSPSTSLNTTILPGADPDASALGNKIITSIRGSTVAELKSYWEDTCNVPLYRTGSDSGPAGLESKNYRDIAGIYHIPSPDFGRSQNNLLNLGSIEGPASVAFANQTNPVPFGYPIDIDNFTAPPPIVGHGSDSINDFYYYHSGMGPMIYPSWLNMDAIIAAENSRAYDAAAGARPQGLEAYLTGDITNECMALLNYVPNSTPNNNTIQKISLDNCSLPILSRPDTRIDDWNSNVVYNTINNFATPNSSITIRDICPTLCQTDYKGPETPMSSPVNIYNVPTEQLTVYDDPLWIIPVQAAAALRSDDDYIFKEYISLQDYYARSLPPMNTGSNTLKNLITTSGKETIHIFYLNSPSPTGGTVCTSNSNIPSCTSPSPQGEGLFSTDELVKDISDFDCRREMLNVIQTECMASPSLTSCIRGNTNIPSICNPDDLAKIDSIGVLFQLKKDRLEPWLHLSEEQEPGNFMGRVKSISQSSPNNPYLDHMCNPSNNNTGVTFTKIDQSKDKQYEFFKPRYGALGVSRIFKPMNNNNYGFGCIRDDIMNVEEDFFDLSCNTNTIYNIERNKFVLINAIIEESIKSTTDQPKFNISDRTKLVLMDEEELIQKAADLNLDMNKLNEYTKPKLINRVKDIYDPSRPSPHFEMWDELEQRYLMIDSGTTLPSNIPKLGVKVWDFEGCGLDHNNIDSSRSFQTCKDRYPGLCQKNESLCNSTNTQIKEAIMLDCPETCNVQFSNLNEFQQNQVGDLSICTQRGRCKWSRDQDEANLLPMCDETSARTYGDNEKCEDYQSLSIGSCISTNNSPPCLREKCESMQGCNFQEAVTNTCLISNRRRDDLTAADCNRHLGRWTGQTGDMGSCLIPEYYDSTLTREECNALAGTYIDDRPASCIYSSQNWLPLEDPCSMPNDVNLNSMSEQELSQYQNKLNESITISRIEPKCIGSQSELDDCRSGRRHPGGFQITLSNPHNIQKGDYIHITTPNIGQQCSVYLEGYSKVIDMVGHDIIIRGPSQSYTLELDLFNPDQYDIGTCIIDKNFTIIPPMAIPEDQYTDIKNAANICTSPTALHGGSCTYVESEDPAISSGVCKSCSLVTSRDECVDENRTSTCGWGEIRDICESIGNIGECNDMYVDGCYWDVRKEMCLLNEKRKDEGCMKCGDIKHNHTCSSLSNCFFDRRSAFADPDGNGICRSCFEAFPGESTSSTGPVASDCNTNSEGKCQWRDIDGKFRCRPVEPYPFIYEWIWYNKFLLVCLGVALYFWYKIPSTSSSTIFTILLIVVKIFILVVIIPGLFVVPGITRADGYSECSNGQNTKDNPGYTKQQCEIDGGEWTVVRKYYMDPPINPQKPGWLDFLHSDNTQGALWPAVLYDNHWDDKIMDNTTLRTMIDLEIWPNSLNWNEYLFWKPIRTWNYLVNANQDSEYLFLFSFSVCTILCIYGLSVSNIRFAIKNPTPKTTVTGIILMILTSIYINFMRETYHKAYIDHDNNEYSKGLQTINDPNILNKQTDLVKYYGRQEAAPTGNSIWSLLYSTKKKDESGQDIHVCPVGCRLYTSDDLLPTRPSDGIINFAGDDYNVFPTPVDFPACGDTRSFFSFRSLYPDEKVKIDHYDHSVPTSVSNWTYHRGDTDIGYICPKRQPYYKWPYDEICKDKRDECVSDSTYGVATPEHPETGKPKPIPTENMLVSDKGKDFRDDLDAICTKHNNEYGVCETYDNTNLAIDPYDDKTGVPKRIKINCVSRTEHDNSSCPFPENSAYIDYFGDVQRQPIKLWKDTYDNYFGPTPHRRLSKSDKLDWQNEERYAIVDQNFMLDRQ